MPSDEPRRPKVRYSMEAVTYHLTLDPIPLDQDPTGGVRIGRPERSPSLPPLPLPEATETDGRDSSLVEFTDQAIIPPDDDKPAPPPG